MWDAIAPLPECPSLARTKNRQCLTRHRFRGLFSHHNKSTNLGRQGAFSQAAQQQLDLVSMDYDGNYERG